jgi:hypothetical protein
MKKTSCSLITLTCFAAFIFGCTGGVVNNTIPPSPAPNVKYIPEDNTVEISGVKKVAVFPFADYSHQQDFMGINAWGGNIKIIEEITDHLVSHGMSVTVQEDVNTLLIDQAVIRPVDRDKYLIYGTFDDENQDYNQIGTPEHELTNFQHSPAMTQEIFKIIKRENRKKQPQNSMSPITQGATVGLTKDKVIEMGQILGVDMVIRGRIIDYGYKDVGTINPLYRGFVPVVIDSVKDLLFGASGSYGYEEDLDDIENMAIGAAMGYIIGNQVIDTSSSHSSSISNGLISRRVSSSNRSHDDNAPEGAAIGAAAGWMASQHPKKAKRSAVVQVRVYAQDALSGDVLWSNRVEMQYTPKSNFAFNNTHPKVMFDAAVKEGIKTLMDNFLQSTL